MEVLMYVLVAVWIVSVLIGILITILCIRRTDDIIAHKIQTRVSASASVLPVVNSDTTLPPRPSVTPADSSSSTTRKPLANRFSAQRT
jgi:hypothetical protein